MKTPQSRIKTNRDFILSLTEGLRKQATRPNIHGYKAHDRQVVFHSSSAKKKLFIGGNRSGKTVGGAVESVWWLTGKHPYIETPKPPVRGRCISVDLLHGVEQIVKPEISRWLPPSELQEGSWEKSYNNELRILTLSNGSTLEFMSYEQTTEKFAGTSRHFIWFDEEPPRDIYIECLLRLVDTSGSFWITMTPVDGMSSWVYDELYIKAKETDEVFAIEVDMQDNPHLNLGEAQLLLAGLSKEEIEAREHGRFIQIGGLIYKMWSPSLHVIDTMMPPRDWLHVAGGDHGFNNPTAWLWAGIDPDGRVIIYDEYYRSGEIVQYHAAELHKINLEHERVPDYYVADPSIRNVDPITGTSVLIEYTDHGIPIVLGNNDVKAGLNRVARYLTGINNVPRLFVTKNCVNLIREMGRLRWATWTAKKIRADRNPKEEQHKKDDHAADALRYLIASRPENDHSVTPKEKIGPMGASVAIDPTGRIDEDVLSGRDLSRSLDYSNVDDMYLGGEF